MTKGWMALSKKRYATERTERRISAATSLGMCALTVLVQIATSLLLAVFLLCFNSAHNHQATVIASLVAVILPVFASLESTMVRLAPSSTKIAAPL